MFTSSLREQPFGAAPKGVSLSALDFSPELEFLDIAESFSVLGEAFEDDPYLDGSVSFRDLEELPFSDLEDAGHVDSFVEVFDSLLESASLPTEVSASQKAELPTPDFLSYCDVDHQVSLPVDELKKESSHLSFLAPSPPSVLIRAEEEIWSEEEDIEEEKIHNAVKSREQRWSSLIPDIKIPRIAGEEVLGGVKRSFSEAPRKRSVKRLKVSPGAVHDPSTCWVCCSDKSEDRKAALHRYIRKRTKRLTARPVRYEARSAVASGRNRQRGRFVESVQWVTL